MTQTLPKSPLLRLALLRRMPFWAQAAVVCALFAIVGVAAPDDYGVALDEVIQRNIAIANADYIITGNADRLREKDYRYYGIAIEMPLLLAERALGLEDSRHIYLMRHLLSHLFFIAGGFVCGMLAYRMLGSRWVALLAMLMFLLHPRLYAHSFFNSKDVPFAVMLIIALYLAHRAFRRDSIGAFLLCGIGVGLLINIRPFALMLPPMILAMRAPDMWHSSRAERKRILTTCAVFAVAALATAYISHPYYWENPLRFIEIVISLSQSQHPSIVEHLFMGETYLSNAVPWNYIPVWFAITAPPFALSLGAIGCAAVCWQAITRPLVALRDRESRFRILSLGCFALPVAVAIALKSELYHDWRHMYFLWGPFCLLAAVGLRSLASGGAVEEAIGVVKTRLPGWVRGGWMRQTLVYGVVGIGLITTLTAMAALHPHQQMYFSALVDTKTPGALAERYDMDYYLLAQLQSLEHLLDRYPDDVLFVWPDPRWPALILPKNDRDRVISLGNPRAADFYLLHGADGRWHRQLRKPRPASESHLHPRINLIQDIPDQSPLHSIRAYGSVIAFIVAKDVEAYRAAYEDVAANGTLLAHSAFDIYVYDGALYYLSANCLPPMSNDADLPIFLHIIPGDLADLPADRREFGFDNLDFVFNGHAAFFDGKCIAMRPLPIYSIARISTGQSEAAHGGDEWRVDIDLVALAAAQALYESIAAGDYGQPVAQSDFDVYLRGNDLAYLKENCAAGDTDTHFFLHIFPADPADMPTGSREHGFENLDFQFGDHGAYAGDKCVVERDLPGYAIERIRTGQFVSGEGRVWGVEFPVGR